MLFLALIPAVAAWNKADYPKPFQLATSDVQWIKEFLKGKDIPNISIRKENSPSDWSKDKTTCVGGNDWALTYDDGSSNNTQLALDALAGSNNKKATFFVTGSQIVENPDMLKKTFDAGHQIGIHTWSHKYLTTLSNEQIVAEIMWTAKLIKEITGVTPNIVRPPYGDIDDRVRALLKHMDMIPVLWNFDSKDFEKQANVVQNFKNYIGSGKKATISLQHDLNYNTAIQIKPTLDEVSKGGYNFVRMDRCLTIHTGNEGVWNKFMNDFKPKEGQSNNKQHSGEAKKEAEKNDQTYKSKNADEGKIYLHNKAQTIAGTALVSSLALGALMALIF